MGATPEVIARAVIDAQLTAAGWAIQDRADINRKAALGVAVREYPLATGPCDYLLLIAGKACGVIEAKKAGTTLSGIAEQARGYQYAPPEALATWNSPLRFDYEASSTEILFSDRVDPDQRSRRIFGFHRPETLLGWLQEVSSLRARLATLPPLITDGLRDCQVEAIRGVEASLQAGQPRALVQMATGAGKTFTAATLAYLNDASLQGQFADLDRFESGLRDLLGARARVPAIKQNLRSTRSLQEALAGPGVSVRQFLQRCRDRDLRTATFNWLDRTGPFVDDDRLEEQDDYFEYMGLEVTATGLGEATRRTKAGEDCASYSFVGGPIDFAVDPLEVDHGLVEERYGRYPVRNHWRPDVLVEDALESGPQIKTWQALIAAARARFELLDIGDLHENPMLAREPFEASVRDRALALMGHLNAYMSGRDGNGAEGPRSRDVIETHFTGERALFTGESSTNEQKFRSEMTFAAADGREVFAPWHGKISHRYFRMHFEWPLAPERRKLPVLYLGPKITKS